MKIDKKKKQLEIEYKQFKKKEKSQTNNIAVKYKSV